MKEELRKEFFSKNKERIFKIAKSKIQLFIPFVIFLFYIFNFCSNKLNAFSLCYIVSYMLMFVSAFLLELSWIWTITKKEFREKYKYTTDYFIYIPASLGYIVNSIGQIILFWDDLNLLTKGDFSGVHNLIIPMVMCGCFAASFGYYGHDNYNYSGSTFVLKTSFFVSFLQTLICIYEIIIQDLSNDKIILAIVNIIFNFSVGMLSLNVTVSTKKLSEERLSETERKKTNIVSTSLIENGEAPFIFISYSHLDSQKVQPIIGRMQKEGYSVWYDAGIDPGTEWDINIASHIEKCGYFIAFISKNYLKSSNCKDELNFARDLDKRRFLVYIEDVQLPSNLRMRLSRIQNIHMYTYNNENEFYSKLYCADGIDEFKINKISNVQ